MRSVTPGTSHTSLNPQLCCRGVPRSRVLVRDLEAFLFRIAQSLNKSKAELRIYDPYYCEGSMVKHLGKLGFASVYNRNEDFYRVIE